MKTKLKQLFGIRFQVLFLMCFFLSLITGINAYLASDSQRTGLMEERKMRGMAILRSWAALSMERLVSGDVTTELAMYDFMDAVMKNEKGVVEIFVQDDKGAIIQANDQSRNGSPSPDTLFKRLLYAPAPGIYPHMVRGEQRWLFYAPIQKGKIRYGVARLVLSSKGIEEGIFENTLRQVGIAAAVVVVGIFFAFILIFRITGPIKKLSQGVKEFGEQFNPSRPETANFQIEFASSNELGELRDSFNQMTQSLKASLDEKVRFKKEATTDAMTGLLNKRQFQDDYPKLLQLAKDSHQVLAMMMVDMDKFKVLNDTVGHKAGDKALQDVAACMVSKIRDDDRAYRVGGDEFVIVLPGATLSIAQERSEQITIAYDAMKAAENMTGISFGIVDYNYTDTPEEFFQKADAEMYRVKKEKKAAR